VEQAFFQRWYVEQTAAMQATVKGLVSSGQLELINGGWCMHDEANPDYVSMIDQTTLGSRWIASEFGPAGTPKVTWQIDPFGHSSTQGSLLSSPLSGYGAVFWARISFDDRANRVNDKSMEWIWKPSPSLGNSALTFASTFRFHYSAPNCASNDISNDGAQPINDDPNLEDNNVADVVNCILDDLVGVSAHVRAQYRSI
jgi:alpha-mannosidase